MIQGTAVKELKPIMDERGWLMEILKSDWDVFEKFGQVYLTTAYPGVVKAWHYHQKQTDNLVCIKGSLKLALYDPREDSPTQGEIMELFPSERKPLLINVPPRVYHGFKAIGNKTAYVLNIPTQVYNYKEPDEYRLPPDTQEIPYDWGLTPGLKHG